MNYLLIINPVSGTQKGRSIFKKILPLLEEKKCNVNSEISDYAGHVYEIANSYDFDNVDAAILIGGDGTMHEFVNGMLDRKDGAKIPIGLIPAGSGNALIHDLNLLHPSDAAQKILDGKLMKMDVAKVYFASSHVYSINVVGWGLPSTINQQAEKLKWIGGQRYNISSLSQIIRNPNWPVKININGETREGNYSFFLACNTIHTGTAMKMAPKANLNDGLFDVLILKEASRLKLINLFAKIFKGDHLNHPLVVYMQTDQFSIVEEKPSKLIVDGQVVGETPFNAKVLQGAIEIFC